MKTTVFKNNRTQAVRIPKEIAYPEGVSTLLISREGDVITLRPAFSDVGDWLENGTAFPDDLVRHDFSGGWRDIDLDSE